MSYPSKREFRPTSEKKRPIILGSGDIYVHLGLIPPGKSNLISQIKRGFPTAVIDKIVAELDIPQGELLEIISIPSATLTRRRNEKRLNSKESDRIYRIVSTYRLILQFFDGDKAAARDWLNTPAKAFRGETPLHHLNTEAGADEVQELIGRLEHGVIT